jgi:hypothetical protein
MDRAGRGRAFGDGPCHLAGIFLWRPLGALRTEICGNLVDRLMLPLPDGGQPVAWDIDLNVVVRYRLATVKPSRARLSVS